MTNTAPTLEISSPVDAATYTTGTAIPISGVVTDPDIGASGDEVRLTVQIDGGEPQVIRLAEDGTFSAPVTFRGGEHQLLLIAADEAGDRAEAEVSFVVTADNLPPTDPVIHVAPEEPQTGQQITLYVDVASVDPEGHTLTPHIQWFKNEEPASTGRSISASEVVRGDVWRVEYWYSDEVQDSTHVTASVTVQNAPPTADVRIGPDGASTLDDLQCEVTNLSDLEEPPEALTVAYAWLVNGTDIGLSDEYLPAGTAVEGDDILCVATLSDGIDTVEIASDAYVLGNASPTQPSVAISPGAPDDNDTLLCTVIVPSTDPDGASVSYTYAWYRDGELTTYESASILPDVHNRGEEWMCQVTAWDVVGTPSLPARASATILPAWTGSGSAADADIVIDGVVANGLFGKTVSLVGDLNGDGLTELLVGAKGTSSDTGTVYLFSGATLSGHVTADSAVARWTGPTTGSQLGGFRSLASTGDLDGDSVPDLLMAAPDGDTNGDGSGSVYLLSGADMSSWGSASTLASTAMWELQGSAGDQAGARLLAEDVNGDGIQDVLIGAPSNSTRARGAGVTAIFINAGAGFTGIEALDTADYRIYGDAELDGMGWTVKPAGDVNADGYPDLLLGSLYADTGTTTEVGRIGLVLGGPSLRTGALSDRATTLFSGDAASDRLGYDALGGLDLDDDRRSDLLIAAYQDDTNGTNTGTVYAFLDRPSWPRILSPADADHAIYGDSAEGRFGHVLTNPGDVDQDGRDDLLIGGYMAEPTGISDQGAAYLLLATDFLTTDSASDVLFYRYGEAASDLFGDALGAGSGDIDGDDLPDFAVGAQQQDTAGTNAGRVYIWRGR